VNGTGESEQGDGVHRSAAAVDRRVRDLLAGEALDDIPDVHLQRMCGVEVALGRPSGRHAGAEHQRVLARAVHPHAGLIGVVADHVATCRRVGGPRRGASQVVLVEPARGEHLAHDLDVPVGAAVAGRAERELFALQSCAGGHAGDRLQWLQAGARQDQRVGVAVLSDDLPVGGEHDRGARMAGFDEAVALHDREFDGISDGESLEHQTSLMRRTVADWRHGSPR